MAPDTATAPVPGAVGRCFVCLTDEEAGDDWVRPCPCSTEGHQECVLQWIDELDREGRPYQCPVCKAQVGVETHLGPLVTASQGLSRAFTRASPFILGTGFLGGTLVGLTAYGMLAFRAVAGSEALRDFMRHPPGTGKALLHVLTLSTTAPVLIITQSLPEVARYIVNPLAFFYGMYHVAIDHSFFAWPPSPQAAFTALPYIYSAYVALWDEFLRPWEYKFERRALGLPDPLPRRERRRARQRQRQQQQQQQQQQRAAAGGNPPAGGFVGLLDAMINFLDADIDIEVEVQQVEAQPDGPRNFIEIEVEAVPDERDLPPAEEANVAGEAGYVAWSDDEEGDDTDSFQGEATGAVGEGATHDSQTREEGDAQPPAPEVAQPDDIARAVLVGEIPVAAPPPDIQIAAGEQPEVPQQPQQPAPPPRAANGNDMDLATVLLGASSIIASNLLLPVFASVAGEALRLVLPKRLTDPSLGSTSITGRAGLLQQMWGRSVVGGGLYIVVRDLLRFYVKYRKAAERPRRRVKNARKAKK